MTTKFVTDRSVFKAASVGEVTFAVALALMLMLGIGVDYSIFLFEHFASGDDTAWLVVDLSALSTLLSFGLLSLSGTPALHAFGLTMLFGTVSVWLLVPILVSSHYQNGSAGRAGAGVKPG